MSAIEVKIIVSDVDYSGAVDVLLPILLEKVSANPNYTFLSSIVKKAEKLPAAAAKAALNALPQDTKDELAAVCLNYYGDDISRILISMAEQKNIYLKVQKVEVSALES